MPIYEYLCNVCGAEFELIRPLSEGSKPVRCPKCNSEAQRLVSGFACKTGASIQVSPKPFRKATTEGVGKQTTKEQEMGTKGRKNVKKPKKQQEKKSEDKKK